MSAAKKLMGCGCLLILLGITLPFVVIVIGAMMGGG